MSRWRRLLLVVVVAYFAFDALDPSVPGIFFFETAHLFIDGVVDAKPRSAIDSTEATRLEAPEPTFVDAPRLQPPRRPVSPVRSRAYFSPPRDLSRPSPEPPSDDQ